MPVGFRMYEGGFDRDESLLDKLRSYRSTDISDATRQAGIMVGINPVVTPVHSAIGFAVTVSVPIGGFDMIKMGLSQTRPGDILVVNVRGDRTNAYWGGNLSRGTCRRGVSAFVIDGLVRDVEEIRDLGFPVFARGISPSAGVIDPFVGEVNVPIACGGVVVNPGDIVVADSDGVAVVPQTDADEVAGTAARITAGYEKIQPILEKGLVTSEDEIRGKFLGAGLDVRAWGE